MRIIRSKENVFYLSENKFSQNSKQKLNNDGIEIEIHFSFEFMAEKTFHMILVLIIAQIDYMFSVAYVLSF